MIAFARGSVQGGNRQGDLESPNRLGEQVEGRVYFVVTDWIGKPVVTLEAVDGHVTGYGLYDDFGFVNRAPMPRIAHKDDSEWAFGVPEGLPNVQTRVLFQELHLDTGEVRIDGDLAIPGSPIEEYSEWTPWMAAQNAPEVYVSVDIPSWSDGFAISEAFEYRVSEGGSIYAFPPYRFPGQRHDPETDLFENWNRYYDPFTGRYLSPEPLLQSPAYVRRMAQGGISVPAYAYAANNPIKYIDPNGLGVIDSMVSTVMWGTGLLLPGAHAGLRRADTYLPWPMYVPYVENHPFMPSGTTTTFGSAICSSGTISAATWKHEEQHLKQWQVFNWVPGMSDLYLPAHLLFQGISALGGGGYDQNNPLETGPYGRQFTGQGHAGDGTAPTRPWPWW